MIGTINTSDSYSKGEKIYFSSPFFNMSPSKENVDFSQIMNKNSTNLSCQALFAVTKVSFYKFTSQPSQ